MDLKGFEKGKKPIERERNVERYLVDQVRRIGGLCKKWVCPESDGMPDRIVIHSGRIEFVELKRPGGKLRPLQQKRREELERQGAKVFTLSTKQEVDDYIFRLKAVNGMAFVEDAWT